jgi:hypothetical protein
MTAATVLHYSGLKFPVLAMAMAVPSTWNHGNCQAIRPLEATFQSQFTSEKPLRLSTASALSAPTGELLRGDLKISARRGPRESPLWNSWRGGLPVLV